MKPLNQAERTNAFLKFLLFFTITIVFIIIAVFFGMRVPLEENKKLKQQITDYQNHQLFDATFSARISDVEPLLDTMGSPNVPIESVNNQINSILADLQARKDKAVSGNDNIYAKTLNALYDLGVAKYSLAKSGTQSQDLGRLEQEKTSLNQRLTAANSQIDYLSSKLNIPSVHY